MKWFTGLRVVVAVALVVLMAAPIALCAVNTQSSRHSCCDSVKMNHQPMKAPSCCSVQAPTQPSVTSGIAVQQVALPTIAVVVFASANVELDSAMAVSITDFSPPLCCTVLRI